MRVRGLKLSKYGIMSVEMQRAYIEDSSDTVSLTDEELIDANDAINDAIEVEAEEADAPEQPEEITES